VLPTCARHGIGVLTYGPLNGGWLTGKYRRGAEPPADSRAARMGRWQGRRWDLEREANRRKLDVIDELSELAADAGLPLSHLATAFAAEHPAVSSVIIGPRTPAQLEDALAATEVRLSTDVLDRIDELVAPGTDLDPLDTARVEPHMDPAARRRPR
jgi:aryl-alcohol dehydrogenase (NADP+)